MIDQAVKKGWEHRRACVSLGLKESRAWRWRARRGRDRLEDRPGGGHAVHGLLESEEAAVVALFEEWGEVDRSHRKLAHRGSYLGNHGSDSHRASNACSNSQLLLRASERYPAEQIMPPGGHICHQSP
jgi:putative transposase